MNKEIWKEIIGYEGYYEISNNSRLRSYPRHGNHYIESIIKPVAHVSGYMVVSLHKEGKRRMFKFHRLVAESWIKNIDHKPYINHKNGNKKDNRIENLEWTTSKENMAHAWNTGLKTSLKMENHPSARKVGSYLGGILIKEYSYIRKVSEDDFSPSGVYHSLKSGYRHKGLHWKYLDLDEKAA